ncbi:hypothetical protein BHE74_00001778 [Ensete ventricosum]|nr:hypothetical protein BHE74_00001778 [Ensete ventricosum]
MRACVDPSPVIDGRRANCNLASLGVHRSKPPTPLHEYNYATSDYQSYYNMYGGAASQYPLYGGAANGVVSGTTGYYPYFQFGQGGGAAAAYAQGQGYGLQYPPMLQYSAVTTTAGVTGFTAQLYGGPMSLAPTPTAQAGSHDYGCDISKPAESYSPSLQTHSCSLCCTFRTGATLGLTVVHLHSSLFSPVCLGSFSSKPGRCRGELVFVFGI